mgnify:CR=1 FL=1
MNSQIVEIWKYFSLYKVKYFKIVLDIFLLFALLAFFIHDHYRDSLGYGCHDFCLI